MNKFLNYFGLVALVVFSFACNTKTETSECKEDNKFPAWAENSNIYEVNIRQYTPEGTINAFSEHLPRLKEMGVDLLWLMPIQPISEKNRKGTLGSYYAVQDYKAVNSDYGSMDDFKALVNKVHELGMHLILDWVPNHTGWDNALIEEHSEWYTKDSLGNIVSPVPDWSDVADLNYDNVDMRAYMIGALKFWIEECNIDGYRCDVAGFVPTDFWDQARTELETVKNVFMLAEWEDPALQVNAFDMTYGWEMHHIMNEIANGKMGVENLKTYFAKIDTLYQCDDIIMNFTSNHDENSWNGTVFERMGDAAEQLAVFTYTIPGMPLIYSGQESKFNRRLEFFEKDSIDWGTYEWKDFYTSLISLKKDNKALWNGKNTGSMEIIELENENVFAFKRTKDENVVLSIFNFSEENVQVNMSTCDLSGFKNVLGGEINNAAEIELTAWDYKVLVR